jgi:NAD-dependent oxidoreductase involved in siderophore biosynthesis
MASVFASFPVAFAQSRICLGLTTETSNFLLLSVFASVLWSPRCFHPNSFEATVFEQF